MTRKRIAIILGVALGVMAAALVLAGVLHNGGTARAQAPPASFTKVSVPDFGQHSTGWCWVGAAANSFWWFAYNAPGEEGLLGGAPGGIPPYPWEATDINSRTVGSACRGAPTSWYDANDIPQGYLGPLPIPGYRQVMSMIAQTTFMDANQDSFRQPAETNYCYSEGVEEWDYLVGLGTYVNSYGSGLKVHSIIDPARCLPGNYGMKPDDRLFPPAFNALNPCGLDGVPDAEPVFDQAPGPPTFLDYQTELSGGQDVLLWMESTSPETAHVVTGVGYNTSPAPGTITISDPWTHSTCPDHDDCWPLKPRPADGQMPDHNNASGHAVGPYDTCAVVNPGPAPKFTINCGGTIWTIPDLIFVSPAGADIKVLTFYSNPPPPFEFEVSENNVINLAEDKHNNGPENAWVDVSWTVDPIPDRNGDTIPDINVRWEALVGDRCTSGGLPVACGEGDGPGSGGSGDGNPSLTGDNCQDGLDNDGDQLTDFADPDCLWELDDVHFQIWMAVSTSTAVNRGLKMHCKVPGDYTVTLRNNEMPVEVEDPDLSNNSRTLDLPVTCTATADVKIVAQHILAANCADPPPTEIDVSVDTDICVQKVLHNNGPQGPVNVKIDKTATAPPGCTILPANPTDQVVLYLGVPVIHNELFTIHCDQASTHGPFTINNTISIKDPGVTDPVPTNNVASSTLTVDALGYADIKITSQSFLNPPSQMTVGVPQVVTVRKVLHNNGLYGPVTVDIAKTAYTDSPNATIAPPTASAQVDLAVSSTVTHDEVFTLRCSAPGSYTYTVDNDVTPKDPHIVDLNGASASTHIHVNCTAGTQGVKWDQLPDASPMGLDVSAYQPFILADDFQCTESGMITQIDFWASWRYDELPGGNPNSVAFTLSLHSDVPAGPSYSHPGETLWLHTFAPGECTAQLYMPGVQEGWFEPPQSYIPIADTQIWLYSCPIPTSAWYQQEKGKIYWVDVQATPLVPAFFGWKTSIDHWNDDGVWSMGSEPIPPASWNELRYPVGHPQAGQSIDLAFEIWGQPCTVGVDGDGDTFNDNIECYLPTDSRDNCPDVVGADDAWPLDVNMDKQVSVVGDVLPYSGRIGATGGPPPSANWRQRLDLNMDNLLTVVGDVLKFSGKIGSKCT